MIRLIVAADRKLGIAKNGGMPWQIPDDEAYFTEMTKTHGGNVLTGGVTFREAYGSVPLAQRHNFILTHDQTPIEGVTLVHDLDEFLHGFQGQDLWVAGGAAVFEQVINKGYADELYLTQIDADFDCDQFFPDFEDKFLLIQKSDKHQQNGFNFRYAVYGRKTT